MDGMGERKMILWHDLIRHALLCEGSVRARRGGGTSALCSIKGYGERRRGGWGFGILELFPLDLVLRKLADVAMVTHQGTSLNPHQTHDTN